MTTDVIIRWIRVIGFTFFLAFTINVIWAVATITLFRDAFYGYSIIIGGIPFTWMYAYLFQYSIHYEFGAFCFDMIFWMLLILLFWTYKDKLFRKSSKNEKSKSPRP